jgi:hypothetical protein
MEVNAIPRGKSLPLERVCRNADLQLAQRKIGRPGGSDLGASQWELRWDENFNRVLKSRMQNRLNNLDLPAKRAVDVKVNLACSDGLTRLWELLDVFEKSV